MASSFGLFVPGRIEVLGKHTDYAGGIGLVCATEQGFCARVVPRSDGKLWLCDSSSNEVFEIPLPPGEAAPPTGWPRYPWTVARRLAQDFSREWRGASITWTSDLPRAAGMSSSSALVIMVFLALAETDGLREHDLFLREFNPGGTLPQYLAAVESGRAFGSTASADGVGTRGGAQDHTAILESTARSLRFCAYDPPGLVGNLHMPRNRLFAIASSGVEACKTGNAAEPYNRSVRLAEAGAKTWREVAGTEEPHFGAILKSATHSDVRTVLGKASHPEFEDRELVRRFDHFYQENVVLLPAAFESYSGGNLEVFGQAVDRSQHAAEDLLGNQVPETTFLQRSARELGALAASAFGAGFGGSVWAMIEADVAEEEQAFLERWSQVYLTRYPERTSSAQFFLTRAAGHAHVMDREPS